MTKYTQINFVIIGEFCWPFNGDFYWPVTVWNDPVDLKEIDLISLRKKAENIKYFITNFAKAAERSIILALFGEWGSGKTTILDYLENNINKDEYVVLSFNAWKYEKDGNLILSIIDALNIYSLKNVKSSELIKLKGKLTNSLEFLSTFSSSTTLNFNIMSIDIDKFKKNFKDKSKLSNYEEIENFRQTYIDLEYLILAGKSNIVILIDEIDRCEPENVINMINFIKLFFTYGEKTVFLLALDENALIQAIDWRYHSKIKSKEYMEKIFDFSFRLPSFNPIQELVYYYLNKNNFTEIKGDVNVYINRFLYAIKFTNPRHLKKVLSKFIYLKLISEKEENEELFKAKDIFTLQENKVLYIIIQLFLIILYEFYNEKFFEIENYELKIKNIIDSIYNYRFEKKQSISKNDIYNSIIPKILVDPNNYNIIQVKLEMERGKKDKNLRRTKQYLMKFLSIFLPNPPMKIEIDGNQDIFTMISQFNNYDNEILINFCKFIINNENLIENNECAIPIKQCFDIVKNYL